MYNALLERYKVLNSPANHFIVLSATNISPMSSYSGSSCSSPSPSPLPTSPTASVHYSLQNTRTEDAFQSIFKSRKSWKTLKGGEVVWPPELEAALIEGVWVIQPLVDRLNLNLYAL